MVVPIKEKTSHCSRKAVSTTSQEFNRNYMPDGHLLQLMTCQKPKVGEGLKVLLL